MSSDPTPPSPSAPPTPGSGLVDFVIAQRATVGWVLVVIGLACAAAGVVCVSRSLAYTTATKPAESKDKLDVEADPEKKDDAEKKDEAIRIAPPYQTEYAIGGVSGLLGAVTGLGLGAWLLAGLPKPTEAQRRTEARKALLAIGGFFGLVLMFGAALFVALPFFGLLVKWADTRVPPPGAYKVVVALLVFLIGAGLAFLAALPARAEERTDPALRRLVYGTNFALSTFLLVLVLFAGNVVAALKLPARLDTTESGFYTLSDATKEYVAALSQPVTAYVTFPDGGDRASSDIHRLLDALSAVNPAKFQVRRLDPVLNRNDLTSLRSKFPQVDFREYGVLLTTGADEKRHAFIRETQFLSGNNFTGESVLAKELLSITDAQSKPVVYFTQNSGELAITSGPGQEMSDPARAATQLKTALENGNAEVKVWTLPAAGDAKVPDDASIVVVADPTAPLPARQADAIQTFLNAAKDGKKGKLVLLAGSHAGLGGKATETGLEGVLAGFQVRVRSDFVYGEPLPQADPETALVVPNPSLRSKNTLAAALADYRVLPFDNARLIEPVRGGPPGGPTTTDALLFTMPGRISWIEPTRVDAIKVLEEVQRTRNQEAANRKQMTESARPVGVVVSEGQTPRIVAIGAGDFFSDQTGQRLGGTGAAGEVMAAAVNWLRDRPAVANIANKTYGTYALPQDFEATRGLWLPFVGIPLLVTAAGLGVWVSRRS